MAMFNKLDIIDTLKNELFSISPKPSIDPLSIRLHVKSVAEIKSFSYQAVAQMSHLPSSITGILTREHIEKEPILKSEIDVKYRPSEAVTDGSVFLQRSRPYLIKYAEKVKFHSDIHFGIRTRSTVARCGLNSYEIVYTKDTGEIFDVIIPEVNNRIHIGDEEGLSRMYFWDSLDKLSDPQIKAAIELGEIKIGGRNFLTESPISNGINLHVGNVLRCFNGDVIDLRKRRPEDFGTVDLSKTSAPENKFCIGLTREPIELNEKYVGMLPRFVPYVKKSSPITDLLNFYLARRHNAYDPAIELHMSAPYLLPGSVGTQALEFPRRSSKLVWGGHPLYMDIYPVKTPSKEATYNGRFKNQKPDSVLPWKTNPSIS